MQSHTHTQDRYRAKLERDTLLTELVVLVDRGGPEDEIERLRVRISEADRVARAA